MFNTILLDIQNGIALVTINRPDKLNALNQTVMKELKDAFLSFKDNDEVKVVIITGSGEKAFVAGADIKELNQLNEDTAREFSLDGQEAFNTIENLGKPVIAAVNGFALGGGCELALACHIRIASENAKFGQPEVNLGIIPGYGGTQRLTRLIGSGLAAEMILTGDMIDAKRAYEINLVNKVVPLIDLLTTAKEIANKIIAKGQISVSLALRLIVSANHLSQSEGLRLEAEYFAHCCATGDFKEGTLAFLEKRKPNFKGK